MALFLENPTRLTYVYGCYNDTMNDKDQYIAELEKANQQLRERLENYENNCIRKLDTLGIGRNIDMQTFCNLITIEQFIDYLSHSPYWKKIGTVENFTGQMEYIFEFIGESTNKEKYYGKRISFILPNKTDSNNNVYVEKSFRSFKNFWDLWISLTDGKKNISLLLDILEYKYNNR